MAKNKSPIVLDEWTSVVDRTVAKVMSYCVNKYSKKVEKSIILLSCHYDIIDWLDPDWIIDCNKQTFKDRRGLRPEKRERKENINFEVKEIDRNSWKYFSKYHYLNSNLPPGKIYFFGLFHNQEQIGFQCYANYIPKRRNDIQMIMHSNRVVVHPDYCGFGLGIKFIDETSKIMKSRGYKVRARFSSLPIYKAMINNPKWRLIVIDRNLKAQFGQSLIRAGKAQRIKVKSYCFEYVGP